MSQITEQDAITYALAQERIPEAFLSTAYLKAPWWVQMAGPNQLLDNVHVRKPHGRRRAPGLPSVRKRKIVRNQIQPGTLAVPFM